MRGAQLALLCGALLVLPAPADARPRGQGSGPVRVRPHRVRTPHGERLVPAHHRSRPNRRRNDN